MRHFLRFPTALLILLALAVAWAGGSSAQGLFAPAIQVNDKVVTRYELDQRTRFLQLLNAPGDPAQLAREQLIEERLKLDAAESNGLKVKDEAVLAGMEEFAGRGNMTAEQFIRALEGAGVAAQSYRDFVRAGVVWRELMGQKFGPRVLINEVDVDRALANATGGKNVRVLLSEIILSAPASQATAVQARAAQISRVRSFDEFAAQARRYSAAPTAKNGGKLDWMPIGQLPPNLQGVVLSLSPGQVSAPIPLDGAIALFQMRAIEETTVPAGEYVSIDYAAYYMAGGRSEATLAQAAKIKARIDTCDDLYAVAKGQPAEVLDRVSKKPSEVPRDIALELAKLDKGEVSTMLTRNNGQTLVFLMMCGRKTLLAESASREQVTLGLQNQRLDSFAKGYLAELKAEARIVDK